MVLLPVTGTLIFITGIYSYNNLNYLYIEENIFYNLKQTIMAKTKKSKRPTWDHAIKCAKTYRTYLQGLPIDDACKTKAFMITKTEIEKLMANNDGIRIYLGMDPITGGFQLCFFPVAVKYNAKTGAYDDVKVPQKALKTLLMANAADTSVDGPGETLPCPNYCSSPNLLNT